VEEEGIPGHAGKTEWSNSLQRWLRECGIKFEAEGEATRASVNGVTIEVAEGISSEGYDIVVSITMPTVGSDLVREAENVLKALTIAGKIAGKKEVKYELDSSLPSYPILYITVSFKDPWRLVESFKNGIREYCTRKEG
jgi:hypothetical protein